MRQSAPAALDVPPGLPPLPWPVLTPEQREHATLLLQLYLTDHYRLRHDFARPEYVMQQRRYSPADLPDGYGSGDIAGHGKGSHSDPTYRTVQHLVDGPGTVALSMPYFTRLPHDAMTALLASLPTNLYEPLAHAYIRRQHYVGAAKVLKLSYRTIGRRCADGLAELGARLYGDRWTGRTP